jgi:hypothetical protein
MAAVSESLIHRRTGAIAAKDRGAVLGLLKRFAP